MTRLAGRANVFALAAGLGVAAAALVLALDPRPPAAPAFRHVGPPVFLDRMVALPPRGPGGADTLLAGGSGLYTVTVAPGGGTAARISTARVPAIPSSALVLGLEVAPASAGPPTSRAPYRVFVGTVGGLLAAPRPDGPYRRLAVHAGGVHGIAVDPSDPAVIWATSFAGPERSTDGGRSWAVESRGMRAATTSWAIAFVTSGTGGGAGVLVASDQDAVYRWTGSSWVSSTAQLAVVSLDATAPGVVFASSMGAGLRQGRLDRAGTLAWQVADAGIPPSAGDPPGVHVVSVTAGTGTGTRAGAGTIYAGTMVDGLATSADGGSTWTVRWPSLASSGDVWRVQPVGDVLVAATDNGILASVPGPAGGSGSPWLLAAGCGTGSALLVAAGGLALLRRRRLAPGAGR